MTEKKCPKCGETKSLDNFTKRTGKRAGKPVAYCKPCFSKIIYSNRKHRPYELRYKNKCKKYIRDIKSSTPCKDCGVQYPWYVMQFDHLYDKKIAVSQMFNKYGLPTIKKEIKKCEIVCANCHAIRTHNRGYTNGNNS